MIFALSAGAGTGRPTRTSGHRAPGRGGRAIEAAMCHRSAPVPARTTHPSVPAKRTEKKKLVTFEPFEPTPVKCGRERCILGHLSSPFRRFGAIHGVPDASRASLFDITPQPSHTMPLMLYQMSSRNLTLILVLSAPHGRAGASPWT